MTQQRKMRLKESTRLRADRNAVAEPLPEGAFGQRKPPENGRFRLQVDGQIKASYQTHEAAEEAALAIKRGFPILHVTVFDAEDRQSRTIALPTA
jgi:hypothetical protein